MYFSTANLDVFLYRESQAGDPHYGEFSWGELLRDAFFKGSVLLLMGGLLIGAVTGQAGKEGGIAPFHWRLV